MKIFVSLLFGSLALGLFFWIAPSERVPTSPSAPLLTPTSLVLMGSATRLRARYEEAILRFPESVEARVDLAQFYLLEARRTSDETYFVPMAERQLNLALDLDPADYRARVQHAVLMNKLHQFEAAEAMALDLIRDHPGHAVNYGTLVDALVELGRYEEAVSTVDTMMSLRPDLSSYSRVSYMRQLYGDSEGAIRAMEMAVQSGAIGSDGRSWALFQLGGLLADAGRLESAERVFVGLMEETPRYTRGLAGLARIRLLTGRASEAVALIGEAIALAPGAGFEDLAIEIYRNLGQPEGVSRMETAIDSGLDAAQAMGENVRMEKADFWADTNRRLEDALEFATAEFKRRPNHLHANETLAWVLHKLGRSEEARRYIDHAMRLENGDAMLAFRAGMIYMAADQREAGLSFLNQSLEDGLEWESPSTAQMAKTILSSGVRTKPHGPPDSYKSGLLEVSAPRLPTLPRSPAPPGIPSS